MCLSTHTAFCAFVWPSQLWAYTCLCTPAFLSALLATCACAWGCVIRAALELYKKSLTVKTIVQTPWFQRCSTTACAARADWTGALERGRETSGSQHPVAAHLPLSLLLPSVSFVRRKGFEHQRAAVLPWRQKQLVRDLVKGGIEENPDPWYSKIYIRASLGRKGNSIPKVNSIGGYCVWITHFRGAGYFEKD